MLEKMYITDEYVHIVTLVRIKNLKINTFSNFERFHIELLHTLRDSPAWIRDRKNPPLIFIILLNVESSNNHEQES